MPNPFADLKPNSTEEQCKNGLQHYLGLLQTTPESVYLREDIAHIDKMAELLQSLRAKIGDRLPTD